MCLHPAPIPAIPEETARVTRAAFPRQNPYVCLRDTLGPVFADEQFASLFPERGQPAAAPWRLALVTLLQFAEGLSDRQAADAVRSRIDWKYLLALELGDPGFDFSVLSEFRTRLVEGSAAHLLFELLLQRCQEGRLLKARGKQRTDSTQVLAAVGTLNRLELVGETVRHALDALAVAAPEWLRERVLPEWIARYRRPFDEYRLPRQQAEREQLALQIGADGWALLTAALSPEAPPETRVAEVEVLRQVWVQQYLREGETLRWRGSGDLPPAPRMINSPLDPEARYSEKRGESWVGYKVHFTESCDPEAPSLITDVQTTVAPVPDQVMLPCIQAQLAARELLPETQYVDAGYVTAAVLAESAKRYGVTVIGPVPRDTGWQAREGAGFAAQDFAVDWEARRARCPGGKESVYWKERPRPSGTDILVKFAASDCRGCDYQPQCTHAQRGRSLCLLPEPRHQALAAARERTAREGFAEQAPRAGVEGTHSQAQRVCGLEQSRYLGLAKTHLQHLATAAGLNLLRVGRWLLGTPKARTRHTAFTRLMAVPA